MVPRFRPGRPFIAAVKARWKGAAGGKTGPRKPPTASRLLVLLVPALVRRPTRDRVALELVGVDLLALHGHLPALVVADIGWAELRLGALVVGVLALGAAERLVLRVVV